MKRIYTALSLIVVCAAGAAGNSYADIEELDFNKQLFTRADALVCTNPGSFYAAANARQNGWAYVPTAGVAMPSGAFAGKSMSPEDFGCKLVQDGVAVTAIARSGALVQTDIGWAGYESLRNATRKKAKVYSGSRPTSCDKHGNHCVYTDVKPYQPVPDNGR